MNDAIREAVFNSLGQVSVAYSELPTGVFDDQEAKKIGEALIQIITEKFTVSEDTSDGYHTFKELYDHRIALFIALMRCRPGMAWRSKQHADGTEMPGWFIAGMKLPTGDITYHLPMSCWNTLDGIPWYNQAPEWDGHTPADVVARLNAWSKK